MYQIEYYPLVLLCVLYAEVKPEPANDGFLRSLWLMKYLREPVIYVLAEFVR